jgi:hypothetical protein
VQKLEDQCQKNAQQNACGQWNVNTYAAGTDQEITRQSRQAVPVGSQHYNSSEDDRPANDDQQSGVLGHKTTP